MGLEKIWYFSEDGHDRKGPLTESELRQALSHGRISEQMLLWTAGMNTWMPARMLPHLYLPGTAQPPEPSLHIGAPRMSGLAIASLVLSLTGFVLGWCCCFGLLLSLLAIIFGHMAQSQIRQQPQRWTGAGLAITGFVVGYISLALYLTIMVIFGVARFLPNMAALSR